MIETPNNANYCLDDEIGYVALIQHVGNDCSVVNSARVSFGNRSWALQEGGNTAHIEDLKRILRLRENNKALLDQDYDYEDWTIKDIKEKITYLQQDEIELLKEKDKDRKLIKFLLEHDHGSPLEHNSLTFLVKCPLFVARQWMRHRMSSFNEVSARYTEVKEEFYIPQKFRKQSGSNRQASTDEHIDFVEIYDPNSPDASLHNNYGCFKYSPKGLLERHFSDCIHLYRNLLAAGVAREQARAVLPLATYTQYYWTCNLRSFLHFIKLRNHEDAQFEIRQYAHAMLEQVKEIFPETIKIWSELK